MIMSDCEHSPLSALSLALMGNEDSIRSVHDFSRTEKKTDSLPSVSA